MSTIAEFLQARAEDDRPGLAFEDERWTYREYVQACADRASLLSALRRPGPFHVGVLADNIPDFAMALGAVSLCGGAVVGLNPTRRGAELARDITHADCQIILTEERYAPLLDGLDLGEAAGYVYVVDRPEWAKLVDDHRGAAIPEVGVDVAAEVDENTLFLLLFTSGTTGNPKAVICTQGRLAFTGTTIAALMGLTAEDVCYQTMPMFHSNALMTGWTPAMASGASLALRRKFSASGFLPDVRRFKATYFNYVGKPLAYILATTEQPDDARNSLRCVFGNEGNEFDIHRFAQRFGVENILDGYGSTESGIGTTKMPGTPRDALGAAPQGVKILNPETGAECTRARFDEEGRLSNAEEAIGEIVNTEGVGNFQGYYRNSEADAVRTRGGMYWSGDLGYIDEAGFLYFAGRNDDWVRVDGENFAVAPVERILAHFPGVVVACVYSVPDPDVGDQLMAALQLREEVRFDPVAFAAFLEAQPDLGTKWSPCFVRVISELPMTQSNKVAKRQLRRERWECTDPVWWRPDGRAYREMTRTDTAALREQFARRGRLGALET